MNKTLLLTELIGRNEEGEFSLMKKSGISQLKIEYQEGEKLVVAIKGDPLTIVKIKKKIDKAIEEENN
jgi:hypothetical protein